MSCFSDDMLQARDTAHIKGLCRIINPLDLKKATGFFFEVSYLFLTKSHLCVFMLSGDESPQQHHDFCISQVAESVVFHRYWPTFYADNQLRFIFKHMYIFPSIVQMKRYFNLLSVKVCYIIQYCEIRRFIRQKPKNME